MAQNTFDFSYFWEKLSTILAGKQATLTTAQQNAVDSGITSAKVAQYDKDSAALPEIVDDGAKNKLFFNMIGNGGSAWDSSSYTHNGITYTLNPDNTVSAYGTADSENNSFCYLGYNNVRVNFDSLCDGLHVLSGCPSGGSTSTWRMYVTKTGYGSYNETGNGLTIPDKGAYTDILLACLVSKGTVIPQNNPIIFKPMICTKSAWDVSQKYVPYALPNVPITSELIELVDTGAKNLLHFDYISGGSASGGGSTWTSNGVEFTITNDNEITVTRTSSSSSDATCQVYLSGSKIYVDSFCDGKHILSGCPSGGGIDTFWIGAYRNNYGAIDFGNGALLGPTENSLIYIQITVKSSYSPSNLVFKPMICTKATWDVSRAYVPYCPNMAELYEMILALQALS